MDNGDVHARAQFVLNALRHDHEHLESLREVVQELEKRGVPADEIYSRGLLTADTIREQLKSYRPIDEQPKVETEERLEASYA